ncbi:hypothetical protein TI39_contig380g00019 [Zymoseptoria brevis]|uniref:Uncharacterized protein n=1 Tax=Zymoseptoria brevis TaxID=1047168 RepID=A0A0F4GS18_9PEZI|nr:hypothetical protein TI39_contig380g00019 [Zymoseptoria brevis]
MRFAAPPSEISPTPTPANVNASFLHALPTSGPASLTPLQTQQYAARGGMDITTNPRKRPATLPPSSDESEKTSPPPTAAPKRRRRPTLAATIDPILPKSSPPPRAPKVRQRKTKGPHASSRVIPRRLADCDAADQMLIEMREAGSDWNPIRAKWLELTGEKTATSTLPNRYSRLKSNFTILSPTDNGHLLSAKRRVESSFADQKWELIAKVVRELGGENYAGVVLKRQYKKLMVSSAGGGMPPEGVRDEDFESEEE